MFRRPYSWGRLNWRRSGLPDTLDLGKKVLPIIASGRKSDPPEFEARPIEMARTGRLAELLARNLKPTALTIRNGVKQADLDEGQHPDGLTTAERQNAFRAVANRVAEGASSNKRQL
jgi:hypothetical protein